MADPTAIYASPQHELATKFLERYGQFIRDLAVSDGYDRLAEMPEFQSWVQDTKALFDEYGTL